MNVGWSITQKEPFKSIEMDYGNDPISVPSVYVQAEIIESM